jgi:hypothetical protein
MNGLKASRAVMVVFFAAVLVSKLSFADVSTTVTYSTSELDTCTIVRGDTTYTCFAIQGCPSMVDPGKPRLSMKSVSLVIPHDEKATSVTITSAVSETLSGEYLVYPAQHMTCGTATEFVFPDSQIYSSSDLFPQDSIELTSDGNMGGYHIAGVLVYPLQYVPDQEKIILHTSITLNVHTSSVATR